MRGKLLFFFLKENIQYTPLYYLKTILVTVMISSCLFTYQQHLIKHKHKPNLEVNHELKNLQIVAKMLRFEFEF